MRSLVLIVAVAVVLGMTLAYPYAGVLLWAWFSLQQPHEEAWGIAQRMPLNLIIALITVAAWQLSKERKAPPSQFLVWTMGIFLVWMTFNSFFAYDPAWSWPYWDRTWKTYALAFMVAVLATNRVRIQALIWICVLSLFYYGVKGGVFTLITGGVNHVFGPPRSEIHDNNALALALLMTVSLALYLRRQSSNVWVSRLLAFEIAMTFLAVIGSYSRGALIGLGAFAIGGILRSRRRFLYLATASVAVVVVVFVMPERFWERASTISSIQEVVHGDSVDDASDQKGPMAHKLDANGDEMDPSFHGRLVAWIVAYRYARDHFPLGAGFYGPQLSGIFNSYFPDEKTHAAHSIYFQVLGEHGFIGLFLFLLILAGAFWKCSTIIRLTRQRPELEWANDLAKMIQLSLFVYCVVGAALSMAYYDLFLICIAILVPLSEICADPRPALVQTRQPLLQLPQTVAP